MPMEVEFVNMGPEHIEVDSAEVSPADLINGRGEEIAETPTVELTGTVGSEEGIAIDHTINQEDGDKQTLLVSQEPDRWIDSEEGRAAIDRYEAEIRYEGEIGNAKKDHTAAALARAAAEDAYKAAKAHEKACLATLSALIARGPDYPKPASPASVNQGGGDNDSAIEQAVRNDKSSPSIPLDDPNADQTWRAISLAPLLDGIKGMGDKKREAILSLTPTLGDFEDLRGAASVQHKQLKDVMPKGVGATMTDEIEERVLTEMRKHQLRLEEMKRDMEEVEEKEEVDGEVEVEVNEVEQEEAAEETIETNSDTASSTN